MRTPSAIEISPSYHAHHLVTWASNASRQLFSKRIAQPSKRIAQPPATRHSAVVIFFGCRHGPSNFLLAGLPNTTTASLEAKATLNLRSALTLATISFTMSLVDAADSHLSGCTIRDIVLYRFLMLFRDEVYGLVSNTKRALTPLSRPSPR